MTSSPSPLSLRLRTTPGTTLRDLAVLVLCLAVAGAFVADVWRGPTPAEAEVAVTATPGAGLA